MASPLDRLRDPAHTGERRCWPCTGVNVALLLLACAAVARRRSRSAAAALGAGGLATVALRGYLVPFTPEFAPRLVAALPGDPFHAESNRSPPGETASGDTPDEPGSLGGETDEAAGERVLSALLDGGVVIPDGESLSLAEDFREAWRAETRNLRARSDDDRLADALRAAAPEGVVVDVVEQGGGRWKESEVWFVVSDGSDDPANERWLTRPVALAEAAGVRALEERASLDSRTRAQAAGALRTFLEACPVCDGPVVETTTVECCGGPGGTRADAPDEVLACDDCGVRVYTFE